MEVNNSENQNKTPNNTDSQDALDKILPSISFEKDSNELRPKTSDYILQELLENIEKVNFKGLAFPETLEIQKKYKSLYSLRKKGQLTESQSNEFDELKKELNSFKLTKNHYLIICIEQLQLIAEEKNWGLCKKNGNIFLYNGYYWVEIDKESFQNFLRKVALKMGVEKFRGKIHTFTDELHKQFMSDAYLTTPKDKSNSILINLLNGTFEITPTKRGRRNFEQKDFITHQLPFEYNPEATSPIFQKYLDEVLPDREKQRVLAEYCGYIFIKPSVLKLEKVLILYGTGANGKSVFFEILNALLGIENMSSYTLQNLTNDNGYYRAKIGNKLVNYASEISSKLEADVFKQMASGEPIEARLPYGDPFILTEYAKLIFNCNELPKDVEHSNAFFRRFLIIGFDITIPEDKQDKQLSQKIIQNELSGIFNWIMRGLDRLLEQKNFSKCDAIDNARTEYEKQSDSVQLFITEHEYLPSNDNFILISSLYVDYKDFCIEDGYRPLGKKNFIERLEKNKLFVKRINLGNVVYIKSNKGDIGIESLFPKI